MTDLLDATLFQKSFCIRSEVCSAVLELLCNMNFAHAGRLASGAPKVLAFLPLGLKCDPQSGACTELATVRKKYKKTARAAAAGPAPAPGSWLIGPPELESELAGLEALSKCYGPWLMVNP